MLSINIPATTKTIENNAFDDCYALEKVVFESPSSLTKIGMGAFNTCKNLSVISIPSTVKEIENYVFTEIEAALTVYYCGKHSFDDKTLFTSNQIVQIIVPRGGVKTVGGRATTFGITECRTSDIRRKTCFNKRQPLLNLISKF